MNAHVLSDALNETINKGIEAVKQGHALLNEIANQDVIMGDETAHKKRSAFIMSYD